MADNNTTVYLDTDVYTYTTTTDSGGDATYYTVYGGPVSQEQQDNGEIAMANFWPLFLRQFYKYD